MKTEQPKGIWIVSYIMQTPTTISNVISWRRDCTEEYAKGDSLQKALDLKPGFSISLVSTVFIPT